MKKDIILAIEGSSGTLSLAIFKDNKLIKENIYSEENQLYSEIFLSKVDIILKQTKSDKKQISKIFTTTGPGLFTATRIILSYVSALGIGLKVPIYSLDSLKS